MIINACCFEGGTFLSDLLKCRIILYIPHLCITISLAVYYDTRISTNAT